MERISITDRMVSNIVREFVKDDAQMRLDPATRGEVNRVMSSAMTEQILDSLMGENGDGVIVNLREDTRLGSVTSFTVGRQTYRMVITRQAKDGTA